MLTVYHIYTTAPTDFKAYLRHIKKGGIRTVTIIHMHIPFFIIKMY